MFWRGVWGYLPAQIVQGVVGFLTIFVFTRLLSAEDFGRYALAFSVMTLAHVATFSWLEAAMARFWAAQRDGADMASSTGYHSLGVAAPSPAGTPNLSAASRPQRAAIAGPLASPSRQSPWLGQVPGKSRSSG